MSLSENDNAVYLVLDASHPDVSVGLIRNGEWLALKSDKAPALNALFSLTQSCLEEAAITLEQVGAFIYCKGPGSMLGLRVAAMAIRTWMHLVPNAEILSYSSLDLARRARLLEKPESSFEIIADWKKTAWHWMDSSSGTIGSKGTDELQDNTDTPLLYISQRKGWKSPPEHATPITYSIEKLPKIVAKQPDFLTETEIPEAFQHSEPEFQKWTPKRHGAE